MRNKIFKISVLPAFIGLAFLSFSKGEITELDSEHSTLLLNSETTGHSSEFIFTVDTTQISYPLLQRDFLGFKEAVAYSESRGMYSLVNRFGYMGKYQFGRAALQTVGIQDEHEFLNRPDLQEAAFRALISQNKWTMRSLIEKYSGKTIGGVFVTESGILAAAHLAGPTGVRRYLKSNGELSVSDAFGTQVKHYLETFGGYDLSGVKADGKALVNLAQAPSLLKRKA